MADASVRPASPDDAPAIARVQAAAWREAYAAMLPAELIDAVGSAEAAAAWEATIRAAPSARHRVLVALDGADVVGLAALAPSSDPDLDPEVDAELHAFCVDPPRRGAGHGSRLANACADVMRGLGVAHLHVWLTPADERLRGFLEAAGWAADGATRQLDLRGDGEVVVDQARLWTTLGAE